MKEMQDRLFNSLMEYWQLIINELVKELEKSYPLGRSTVQEITVGNALPVGKTNTGYKVSLFMPYYYEFMDEGVSGAKFNTGISISIRSGSTPILRKSITADSIAFSREVDSRSNITYIIL